MTFTYTTPPQNPKDEVRFWSTDTVQKPYSVSDEDIEYLLSAEVLDGNVMQAAAVVADRIANWWSSSSTATGSDVKIGPFSVGSERSGSDLEASWRSLAARLRAGGNGDGVLIMSGGLFTGSGEPEFSVGMQDNGYQRYPVSERGRRRGAPENGVW